MFVRLEQYALSHTRFSAPADYEDDFIEQYVKVLNQRAYFEGDDVFDEYMEYVESAEKKASRFIKRHPLTFVVMAFSQELKQT